jgi:hypothetical protein
MRVDEYVEQEIIDGFCPACDGESYKIGQLGNRIWYRCRRCGIDHYEDVENKKL